MTLLLRKIRFQVLAVTSLLCLANLAVAAPVKVRINTSHGLNNARGAVSDVGLDAGKVLVTPSSADNGKHYLPPDKFFEDSRAAGATLLSSSFAGWDYRYDTKEYQRLTDNGMLHVYAYEPKKPQLPHVPPPAAFATVNLLGGATGGGIEFGIPPGYMHGKGQSASPSGVTAQLAGLIASLKYRHPDWNWFDVKAALRSTAANYPTGYDPFRSGYGSIDFQAANELTDAAKLPLFAPAAVTPGLKGDRIYFVINPFKQSRRFTEVVFKFSKRPLPTRTELTLAEITALGGEYLFSNYLYKDAGSYGYRVARGETVFLVWFTQDAALKFSRIEPYSIFGPLSVPL